MRKKNIKHSGFSVKRMINGPHIVLEHNESLYNRWMHIRERCNNPKRKDAKYYHDKGIRMDPEWDNYENFRQWFVVTMKLWVLNTGTNAIYKELVVDRIDPSLGYSSGNCRLISVRDNAKRAIKGRDAKGRFSIGKGK